MTVESLQLSSAERDASGAASGPATALSFKLKETASKPKGIDGEGEVQSVVPKEKPKVVVIPALVNSWNPYGKDPHKDLILRDENSANSANTPNPAAADSGGGVQKPATSETDADIEARNAILEDAAKFEAAQSAKEDDGDPARRQVREMAEGAKVANEQEWFMNTGKMKGQPVEDEEESEENKVQKDIASRPDQASMDDYDNMPIEDFGVGLLRGMGWTGGAIGGKNKGLVEPVMFVPRGNGYAGLGADIRPKEAPKKKFIKPGESRDPKEILVAPTGADGKVRHYAGVSETLVKAQVKQVAPGARVEVVGGIHAGVYAVVLKMLPHKDKPDQVELRLANGEALTVLRSEVEIVDRTRVSNDVLEKKSTRKFSADEKASGFQGGILGGADVFTNLGKRAPVDADRSAHKKPKTSSSGTGTVDRAEFWLRSDIRVRVVCKRTNAGRLYNKKARVVDVMGYKECTIQMEDGGSIVDNMKQKKLETVLPKAGGTVMLLLGKHKGECGKLIEKSLKKESVTVQLFTDMSLVECHLDDAAEYLGGSRSLAE